MEQLRELLESCINEELINAVLSNPKDKEGIQKVKVRPVLMKGEMAVSYTHLTLPTIVGV